jgi:hypothetical protein
VYLRQAVTHHVLEAVTHARAQWQHESVSLPQVSASRIRFKYPLHRFSASSIRFTD